MPIRVVLALPGRTHDIALRVPVGTQARAALHLAQANGLPLASVGLDVDRVALGVFGRSVADDMPLHEHDRLELYRPLQQDPMERRRREADRATARCATQGAAVASGSPRPG